MSTTTAATETTANGGMKTANPLECHVDLAHGGIFFAGDRFQATITFRYPSSTTTGTGTTTAPIATTTNQSVKESIQKQQSETSNQERITSQIAFLTKGTPSSTIITRSETAPSLPQSTWPSNDDVNALILAPTPGVSFPATESVSKGALPASLGSLPVDTASPSFLPSSVFSFLGFSSPGNIPSVPSQLTSLNQSPMIPAKPPLRPVLLSGASEKASDIKQTDSTDTPAISTDNQASETIIYAYAQFGGVFDADPAFVNPSYFSKFAKQSVYGSGSISGLGLFSAAASPTLASAPVFTSTTTILGNDIILQPGEHASFTYELDLPIILPPSHRGRISKFAYKLVVGAQRGSVALKPQTFTVPIQILAHVDVDGSRPVYDVLNPILMAQDTAVVQAVKTVAEHASTAATPGTMIRSARRGSQRLMSPTSNPLSNIILAIQNSRRVSFDICKNNEQVAKIYLARSAFRMGEVIAGRLSFHPSVIPCIQVAVFLEVAELAEPPFAVKTKPDTLITTRKIIAQQRLYVINTKNVGFCLGIPMTGVSPEFQTTVVSLQWSLRFEFLTSDGDRLYKVEQARPVSLESRSHFITLTSAPRIQVSSFDCTVPIKVYSTPLAGTRVTTTVLKSGGGVAPPAPGGSRRASFAVS